MYIAKLITKDRGKLRCSPRARSFSHVHARRARTCASLGEKVLCRIRRDSRCSAKPRVPDRLLKVPPVSLFRIAVVV